MAAASFPDHSRAGTAAGHPGGSWPCWDSPEPRAPVSLCRAGGRGGGTGGDQGPDESNGYRKMPGALGALRDTSLPQPDAMSVFIRGSCLITTEQARLCATFRIGAFTQVGLGHTSPGLSLSSRAFGFALLSVPHPHEGPQPHARARAGCSLRRLLPPRASLLCPVSRPAGPRRGRRSFLRLCLKRGAPGGPTS